MSEQERNEQPAPKPPASEDPSKSERERQSRPKALTSEQRRLLGTPRPLHERMEGEKEANDGPAPANEPVQPAAGQRSEAREAQKPATKVRAGEETAKFKPSEAQKSRPHAVLIIGVIVALGLTFYVGKKIDYWRYLWMTRNKPKLSEKVSGKYAGIPAEELVEQALAYERAGRFADAGERLIAAKHKDLRYRGILFRVGKMAFDSGNLDTADRLLERAMAFGENVDLANYLRGLIATRRRDFPAAERFFGAAVTTEPFVADYYYYWAEALRLDHRPQEALMRYEQAAHRTRDDQDLTVCRFKMRMARLERGENAELRAEIEEEKSTVSLPVDWLLTEAALGIREGRIDDAVRSVIAARAASATTENGGGIFVSCKGDALFQDACKKYANLADAFEVKMTTSPLTR